MHHHHTRRRGGSRLTIMFIASLLVLVAFMFVFNSSVVTTSFGTKGSFSTTAPSSRTTQNKNQQSAKGESIEKGKAMKTIMRAPPPTDAVTVVVEVTQEPLTFHKRPQRNKCASYDGHNRHGLPTEVSTRHGIDLASLRAGGTEAQAIPGDSDVKRSHVTTAGLYCVVLSDPSHGCDLARIPVVVTDPTRKNTEYGVRPYTLPPPTELADGSAMHIDVMQSNLPVGLARRGPVLLRLDCGAHSTCPPFARHMGTEFGNSYAVVWRSGTQTEIRQTAEKDLSSFDILTSSAYSSKANCKVRISEDLVVESLTLAAGCTVLIDVGVLITVKQHLGIAGEGSRPVVVMSTNENEFWRGIVVEEHATVDISHAFLSGSGGGSLAVKRPKSTGSHRKEFPLLTFKAHSKGTIGSTVFHDGRGPAMGVGASAKLRLHSVVVQRFVQGLECVECDVSITSSTFSHIPTVAGTEFVDEDNDGLYLRGGSASIVDTFVGGTKDDCIDTATNKHTTPGEVRMTNVTLTHCLHEGIALSGSVGVPRKLFIDRSTITHTQQGIEMGYSPHVLHAVVTRTTFRNNIVAVRYGDNYGNIAEDGVLELRQCTIDDSNEQKAFVNYVRQKKGPAHSGNLIVDGQPKKVDICDL